MERRTLEATKRQELGSRAARQLRHRGLVPAVLYGHQRDTVHLAVPLKEFEQLLHAGVRMVDLEIGGVVEPALVRDIQYDSMGDHLIHIDLARVAMDEKVTVTVPVELHGLAKGAASGGILDHVLQDLEVRCLPSDIPERVRIEITDLDMGEIVHVRDVEVPPGVEFLHDPDATVLTIHPPVTAPAVAVAEEEVEVEGGAEPEVIGGRREEEEPPAAAGGQRGRGG